MFVSPVLLISAFAGCNQSDINPLPPVEMPSSVWVLRESFQEPGPDRTGNWRGWFDAGGCWWEEHNTWLVVTDPVLQKSDSAHLFWNGARPAEPWFCLSQAQAVQLRHAVSELPASLPQAIYTQPVDRWTVRTGPDQLAIAVVRRRGSDWQSVPVIGLFHELAAMSVWGQSPE